MGVLVKTLAAALLATALVGAAPATAQEGATEARGEAFDKLPYWPGYWVPVNLLDMPISGIRNDLGKPPGPETDTLGVWAPNIPWNEEGRRRVAENAKTMNARKGKGWSFPTMMTAATPFQVLITPEEVLIINAYNEARHIYTDGRDHPAPEDLWPTTTGNSIGHWEGNTLVIDTIQVTNPNEYFQGAPPLSEEAHYVERIRLDGETLRGQMTIEDPVTLSAPWVSHLAWSRDTGFDRMIQVDWSNDRTGSDGEVNTIEPPKD
ncbi:hypothetical protein GRI89_09605 [Altererythrobacter salegens]|uniref:Uncharacterized protein n=1 Tax=Croceibacterium salegens TaxID=1737568 RepID=A0A6I4SUK3_9SPHN|nr:hypothetical protein [Croceibacterium salegens]MXO59794.1 hypothetical protein [Croceibacterium salegens]